MSCNTVVQNAREWSLIQRNWVCAERHKQCFTLKDILILLIKKKSFILSHPVRTQFTDKTLVWIKADCKASDLDILTKFHVVQHKTALHIWIFFSEHSCGLLKNKTKKTKHVRLNNRWLTPSTDTEKKYCDQIIVLPTIPKVKNELCTVSFYILRDQRIISTTWHRDAT